jgi:hypothetical protein
MRETGRGQYRVIPYFVGGMTCDLLTREVTDQVNDLMTCRGPNREAYPSRAYLDPNEAPLCPKGQEKARNAPFDCSEAPKSLVPNAASYDSRSVGLGRSARMASDHALPADRGSPYPGPFVAAERVCGPPPRQPLALAAARYRPWLVLVVADRATATDVLMREVKARDR